MDTCKANKTVLEKKDSVSDLQSILNPIIAFCILSLRLDQLQWEIFRNSLMRTKRRDIIVKEWLWFKEDELGNSYFIQVSSRYIQVLVKKP